MWYDTPLTRLIGITYPIIQAPMAGAAASPELVAAVSNAGGLGSLGAGYLSPEQIRQAIARIRTLTDRPFGVNLLVVPEGTEANPEQIAAVQKLLQRYWDELGLGEAPTPSSYAPPFSEQTAAILEARIPVFSFAFGIPPAESLRRMKEAGTVVLGTATTVAEAQALARTEVDGVVAQGSEAGGHRGTFLGEFENALVGTAALVPQVVDAVSPLPVVASGGLMDGRGLIAALALGAGGVQMGTAFLVSAESAAAAAYKKALLAAHEDSTALTIAFSGRPARGVRNRFMVEMAPHAASIAPYPVQNALTRDLRAAAAKQGRAEFLSLWAGQGVRMAREISAAQLVAEIVAQAEQVIEKLRLDEPGAPQ